MGFVVGCGFASTFGEDLLHRLPYLGQPRDALLRCAGDDHRERPALDVFHAAQTEDTFLPEQFQGVAKDFFLPLVRRVSGVENNRHPGLEQADGHAFALVAFDKVIRHFGPQHAVNPALEDGRRHAPPVRMHDDDAVRIGDFIAVSGHNRIKLRVLLEFRRGKQRWKLFLAQVVKDDFDRSGEACPPPWRQWRG